MFLKEKLNLTLSVEKTKITHATDRARFLGYDISISKSQEVTKRQGRKVKGYSGAMKLYMPHEKWEAKLLEYGAIRIKKDKVTQKEHWKAIHRPQFINRKDIEILSKYNSEIRGLCGRAESECRQELYQELLRCLLGGCCHCFSVYHLFALCRFAACCQS